MRSNSPVAFWPGWAIGSYTDSGPFPEENHRDKDQPNTEAGIRGGIPTLWSFSCVHDQHALDHRISSSKPYMNKLRLIWLVPLARPSYHALHAPLAPASTPGPPHFVSEEEHICTDTTLQSGQLSDSKTYCRILFLAMETTRRRQLHSCDPCRRGKRGCDAPVCHIALTYNEQAFDIHCRKIEKRMGSRHARIASGGRRSARSTGSPRNVWIPRRIGGKRSPAPVPQPFRKVAMCRPL